MFCNPKGRAASLILAFTFLVGACGDSSKSLEGTVVKDGLGCTVSEVDRPTSRPAVAAAEPVTELAQKDLKKADKKACLINSEPFATVDMVGVKASDGTVFVDTFGQDHPLVVKFGTGQLIAGLENGLADMGVGGRRQITVPAEQAYGEDGDPDLGIGADETLVFVVDLVAVTREPTYCNEPRPLPSGVREGKPGAVDMPVKPWTELSTTDITPGDGATAKRDSLVTVEYVGVGCFSGSQFDSSWDREDVGIKAALADAPTVDGFTSVIPGWTDGIEGMKVGGTRQINIPSDLAYGAAGSGPDISANEPLIFVVKLVEITPPPAETTTTAPASDSSSTTTETTTADATTTTEG